MSAVVSDPIPDSITGNGSYPGWIAGFVPSAAEWNDWYSRKFDAIPDIVTIAGIDTRPYTQQAGANMIWLATGHRIAFNEDDDNFLQYVTSGGARLQYVVNGIERFSVGDTGLVTLGADPTLPVHAVTKHYLDTNFALKSGGAISGDVDISGTLALNGNLSVTGTTGLHGNVAVYQQLQLAAASAPNYVLYGNATHLFHQYQSNGYWQLTRSSNQLDWIVDTSARVSFGTQAVFNSDIVANGALELAGSVTPDFLISGDATHLFHQYAANYRWDYTRASHDLTWILNSSPALRVDGTLGTLYVVAGDRGIAPISHTYLTISGSSTSFNDGANFVLASTGNRAPYAFEWYWGATRIGTMDTGGAVTLSGSLHIKSGVNGLAPSDETYLAINGSPSGFNGGANILVSSLASGRTNAVEFYWGPTILALFDTVGNLGIPGTMHVRGGDNGVGPGVTGSYLSLCGSSGGSTAGAAVTLNASGGPRAFAFEWLWLLTRVMSLSNAGDLDIVGNLTVHGDTFSTDALWQVISDARLKTDVKDYRAGLDEICQLRPVSYQFNGRGDTVIDGKTHYGLIAQEVAPFMPEMVGKRLGKILPSDEKETDIYTLDATPLIYALVTAVQELSERITQLELQSR